MQKQQLGASDDDSRRDPGSAVQKSGEPGDTPTTVPPVVAGKAVKEWSFTELHGDALDQVTDLFVAAGPQPLGMSFRAAVTGTRQFWILVVIFIAVGTANNGSLGHLRSLVDAEYGCILAAHVVNSISCLKVTDDPPVSA